MGNYYLRANEPPKGFGDSKCLDELAMQAIEVESRIHKYRHAYCNEGHYIYFVCAGKKHPKGWGYPVPKNSSALWCNVTCEDCLTGKGD